MEGVELPEAKEVVYDNQFSDSESDVEGTDNGHGDTARHINPKTVELCGATTVQTIPKQNIPGASYQHSNTPDADNQSAQINLATSVDYANETPIDTGSSEAEFPFHFDAVIDVRSSEGNHVTLTSKNLEVKQRSDVSGAKVKADASVMGIGNLQTDESGIDKTRNKQRRNKNATVQKTTSQKTVICPEQTFTGVNQTDNIEPDEICKESEIAKYSGVTSDVDNSEMPQASHHLNTTFITSIKGTKAMYPCHSPIGKPDQCSGNPVSIADTNIRGEFSSGTSSIASLSISDTSPSSAEHLLQSKTPNAEIELASQKMVDDIPTDTPCTDNVANQQIPTDITKFGTDLENIQIQLPTDKTNADNTESKHIPTDEPNAETGNQHKDKDDWTCNNWRLDRMEYDLPQTGFQMPFVDVKQSEQQAMRHRRRRAARLFHKRKSSSASDKEEQNRMMMSSPYVAMAELAKQQGTDLPTLMEHQESLASDVSIPIPCAQCYDPRRGGQAQHRSQDRSNNGKCPTCGSKIMTLGSFGKSILQMNRLLKDKALVTHDVYPDGNCQFSAVVDQLRIRGNFYYTVRSLRRAAVQFLADHPYADEDTHLELFLDSETWEDYLQRIEQDGEWGDHMLLNAIANVINLRIVVYGGMSGQQETVLLPLTMKDNSADTREGPGQLEDLDTVSIYLGHVTESHYISLRPEHWQQNLQTCTDLQLRPTTTEQSNTRTKLTCNVFHIDNIVKKVLQLHYISSVVDQRMVYPEMSFAKGTFHGELVGHIISHMYPVLDTIESFLPDIDIFFPAAAKKQKPAPLPVLTVFVSPKDTLIRDSITEAKTRDLIVDTDVLGTDDIFLLQPKTASLWEGQTFCDSEEGKVYLRGVNSCMPISRPSGVAADYYEVLTFRCAWPSCAAEWIFRPRATKLMSQKHIDKIARYGCHVMPVLAIESLNDVIDYHVTQDKAEHEKWWCYSFAVAEREMCRNILKDQQRYVFLLFKYLVDYIFTQNPLLTEKPLPTSVVKSVFYYACEKVPEEDWKCQPGQCIMIMVNKLLEGLLKAELPHYFMSHVNLLSDIPTELLIHCSNQLQYLSNQFLVQLYFVLDSTHITCSEIGAFVDDIIDDIVGYSSHKNILQSFESTIITACGSLVETLFYQDNFSFALEVIEDLQEQMCLYTGDPVTHYDVIKTTMTHMVSGQQYCVAFYIDMWRTGTNLTEEICYGHSTVPITEVFGPNLPEHIKHKKVITSYAIGNSVVNFAEVMATVFEQCNMVEVVVNGLTFYLQTYADLAGDNLIIETCDDTNSNRKMRFAFMNRLFGLYTHLLNVCVKLDEPELFRTSMPTFIRFVVCLATYNAYDWLRYAWQCLGDYDHAEEAAYLAESIQDRRSSRFTSMCRPTY